MITIEQVQTLRNLHDIEKEAYINTFKSNNIEAYYVWVKACDELNTFIASIVVEK